MTAGREHTLSTADLAGGTTTGPTDRDEPMGAEMERRPEYRGSEPESREVGTAVADRGMADRPMASPAAPVPSDASPLFPAGEAEDFRTRWGEIQTGFVDEPRRAVEQADGLVAEMMQRLAQVFADERGKLEEQWSRGDDISTEDLRVALQRYRSFFDRLLSV